MGRSAMIFMSVMLLSAALGGTARADSIKLDSGKVLEGSIVAETSATVQIAVGGTVLTIARTRIAGVSRAAPETTSPTATLEQLEALETKGAWADLYEAAAGILSRDTSNTVAIERQKLAADKIRESLGGKKLQELVRERKYGEAMAFLTEQYRRSGLSARGAGAVARRALAELYLGSAEYRLRRSLDGHLPLSEARKARELDPSTPGLDYIEGRAQMNLHNFDQAAVLLERAAQADPRNFGIRLQLLKCYRQNGDFLKIVRTYEGAPTETSASAIRWPEVRNTISEAYLQVAVRMADKGTTTEAAAAYEKHLIFCDRTADDLRDAASFFERIGDSRRAKALREERPRAVAGETSATTDTSRRFPPRR